jgi:hypothetical protein
MKFWLWANEVADEIERITGLMKRVVGAVILLVAPAHLAWSAHVTPTVKGEVTVCIGEDPRPTCATHLKRQR